MSDLAFRKRLVEEFSREELLGLILKQDPELHKQVRRIEWVFENKLTHLTWFDGTPISGRPVTNEELALLIDEPFTPDRDLTRMGVSIEQQHQIHIAKDPVLWARHFLNQNPRVYQIIMLRDPSTRKVLRAGRRLGKTFTMALMLLHYSYTSQDGKCLVVAPMKSHVELIYKEIMRMVEGTTVKESIIRAVTSPQFVIEFTNGATVRMFTSGMKSGGKSNVARGQEAHIIVLDELDYMGEEDLVALYAMLQTTDDNQAEKILVGASTPTGQHGKFWEWCHASHFREFYYPSYCFGPEEKVVMADGQYINIKDIRINDFVLTEKGPQKVLNTYCRDYEGDILNITTYGRNQAIQVTPEHPFSAQISNYKQNPSYKGKHIDTNWDWVKAGELNVRETRNQNTGHWLRYIFNVIENDHVLDILNIIPNLQEKDGRVFIQGFKNDLPRFIELDSILATLAGWYLAEGSIYGRTSVGPNVIEWTLSSKERHIIEELQLALDKLDAGKISIQSRPNMNTLVARITNPILVKLMVHLCGAGSLNKSLSQEILNAPISFQREFIHSYARGDGWEFRDGSFDIRTSSAILAHQIRDVSARLGWIPSISVAANSSVGLNGYGPYKASPTWLIAYRPSGRSMLGKKILSSGEGAFLIKDIKSTPYVGKVYNLEVENTNSYLINGLLVHNCNPHFDRGIEEEMRAEYTEMDYRHEIEADWGEDTEGVYPRKYVDIAFNQHGQNWAYEAVRIPSRDSIYLMGVDWDKFGAGVNIVILEICGPEHAEKVCQNKIRVCFREEVRKGEYTLLDAVDRIINLNAIFNPKWIYVDRGYGEAQLELLKKHGVNNPITGLNKKVIGHTFSDSIEMPDPQTKMMVKKEIKPFMVNNLRQMLEEEIIVFPASDEDLYMQLISYVVRSISVYGRQTFEMAGKVPDHAHDALMLACLAYIVNYSDMMKLRLATKSYTISNEAFLNTFNINTSEDENIAGAVWDSPQSAPVKIKRQMAAKPVGISRPIRRSSF